MGRDMSLDGWDFGLSKAHKHIIYTAFKDKFKERKFSGLSAYVSRKDCENFIANSRASLKVIEFSSGNVRSIFDDSLIY